MLPHGAQDRRRSGLMLWPPALGGNVWHRPPPASACQQRPHGISNGMSMLEAMRQATPGAGLAFRTGSPGERAGFTLRTLLAILASGACYYLATRIAWLLCF